jgi:hypothetical protein
MPTKSFMPSMAKKKKLSSWIFALTTQMMFTPRLKTYDHLKRPAFMKNEESALTEGLIYFQVFLAIPL